MSRNWLRAALAVLAAVALLAFGAIPANAAQHQNANLYVNWNPTSTAGFWNVDQNVYIVQKATSSYWPLVWKWRDEPSIGGYMGLQTNGNRFDGTTGDTAVFSIWAASVARGPSCRYVAEGASYSCRLPFAIQAGAMYKYRLWRQEADLNGQWWGAWIIKSDGTEYWLGDLRVSRTHTFASTLQNFSEYYGSPVACNKVPQSKVFWTQPAGNSLGGGRYEIGTRYSSSSKGSCTNGSASPQTYNGQVGVMATMGG